MVNEFFKSIFRTLGRIMAYIVLAILAYFIITWFGLPNVKAQTYDSPKYVILNSPSYNNVPNKTCYQNECPESLIGTMQVYQQANFYWDFNFESGKSYSYQIQGQVITNTQIVPNSSNIGYVFRFLGNQVVNATCDAECEVNYYYRGTTNYIDAGGVTPHNRTAYIYEVDISGVINVTQNFSSFGFNVNIGNIIWGSTYSYAVITDNSSDTQAIIDNQNKATDKLIKAQEKMFGWILDGIGNSQYLESQNTQAIEDLNTDIMDDSDADFSILTGISDLMPSNTPVTDVILLPISILNKTINALGGTCSPYTINSGTLLGNHNITFPCINPGNYLSGYSYKGFTLWELIDLMFCMYMGYEILMLIISAYNGIANLEDSFDALYVPKHKGYAMKHGEGRI